MSRVKIAYTYNLGGRNRYVVGYRKANMTEYYEFIADNKSQIVNMIAGLFNSQAYMARNRGVDRVYIMNDPTAFVYFLDER